MNNEATEIRKVAWTELFPALRLLRTFSQAVAFWPMVMGFAAVAGAYVAGRALDSLWVMSGRGALTAVGEVINSEPHAFATPGVDFHAWRTNAQERREAARIAAEKAAGDDLNRLTVEMNDWVDRQLAAGEAALDADSNLSSSQRAQRRRELRRSADAIRFILAGKRPLPFDAGEQASAARVLVECNPATNAATRGEELRRLDALTDRWRTLGEHRRLAPRGPMAALLSYEMDCFASAVQGVCAGRLGFGGSAGDAAPSMLGGLRSALGGVAWIGTRRPIYSLVYGVLLLAIVGYFGGGICRYIAVKNARDIDLSASKALAFIGERLGGIIGAPLLCVGICLLSLGVMAVGGLFGAIPWIGEIATGLAMLLYLLGGVAVVFAFLTLALGFQYMWPTIAVEGSDTFDGFQHGASFAFQRLGTSAFYSIVTLVLGGVCFAFVRMATMLALKFAHLGLAVGMSFFGTLSSAETSSFSKLDAMWSMPGWDELSLLPAVGPASWWGDFAIAPLSTSESVGMFLIAAWVFCVVGAVGGFVVSFYFTAATHSYLLLRKSVDLVDYDEIYFDEDMDELYGVGEAAETASPPASAGEPAKGVSLPIAGTNPGGSPGGPSTI